ncbi:MAG: hypothetical protein ACLFU9_08055 [Candidatus Bathyarchaeia archaeon]
MPLCRYVTTWWQARLDTQQFRPLFEVKKALEKAKGGDEWGEFLLKLYLEVKRLKSENAFKQLANLLTDEDLKTIAESTEKFRERFTLR